MLDLLPSRLCLRDEESSLKNRSDQINHPGERARRASSRRPTDLAIRWAGEEPATEWALRMMSAKFATDRVMWLHLTFYPASPSKMALLTPMFEVVVCFPSQGVSKSSHETTNQRDCVRAQTAVVLFLPAEGLKAPRSSGLHGCGSAAARRPH